MNVKESKCFPEDASHENGNYQNKCYKCGELFIGHKRRVTCKECEVENLKYVSFIREHIKLPVKYDRDSYFILDDNDNAILEVRGWGHIQNLSEPEEKQDLIGEYIAACINRGL